MNMQHDLNMPAPAILARRIALACDRVGEAPTLFGRRVAHDPRLYTDLRNGRFLRERLARKVLAALSEMEGQA
jgi:hypothetical protein